jgi:hypothetical protein
MTYSGKTQQTVLLIFLILGINGLFTSRNYPDIYSLLIPYILFILVVIFLNFNLRIEKDTLTYEIFLFSIRIYKKEVDYKQIDQIKFKRVGWATKSAVVKNKQGFHFRITNFKPEEVYDDLIDYAEGFDIPLTKTKDYQILERLN